MLLSIEQNGVRYPCRRRTFLVARALAVIEPLLDDLRALYNPIGPGRGRGPCSLATFAARQARRGSAGRAVRCLTARGMAATLLRVLPPAGRVSIGPDRSRPGFPLVDADDWHSARTSQGRKDMDSRRLHTHTIYFHWSAAHTGNTAGEYRDTLAVCR
jgi:hypothetical protein